jgi:hypothetical protein
MREEFSDLNLVVGSNMIAAHQLVLAAHSAQLAHLLAAHTQVGIYQNIQVADTSQLLDKTSLVLAGFSLQVRNRIGGDQLRPEEKQGVKKQIERQTWNVRQSESEFALRPNF